MENPSAKFEIIHEIVSQEDNLQNVRELCRIAGVSRSGYYNWLASTNNRLAREQADRLDFERILETYNYRGYNKRQPGHPYAPAAHESACFDECQENSKAHA